MKKQINVDLKQVESVFEHHQEEDSLYVTSDGNVFLTSGHGKNFVKDHCSRMNESYAVITRQEFEEALKSGEKMTIPAPGDSLSQKVEGDVLVDTEDTANAGTEGGEGSGDNTGASEAVAEGEEGSKEDTKGTEALQASDWKDLKWDEMIAFANAKDLHPTTKMNQGKKALIKEIETLLASTEVGANNTTNHIDQ